MWKWAFLPFSFNSTNQGKERIPLRIWVRRAKQWVPWTSSPPTAPSTRTDHRSPRSSRRAKAATAYTGWPDLTPGPGLWRRSGTDGKRCLGSKPSRSRTLFIRKSHWTVDRSFQTKWYRSYGLYTLLRRKGVNRLKPLWIPYVTNE